MYGQPDNVLRSPGAPKIKPALFEWGTALYSVDYPPGTLLFSWVSGKLYRATNPEMPNRWRFNVYVNLPPFVASIVCLILLLRSAPGPLGERRALAYWLNPAIFLASPVLGYQDPLFAALGLGSVLCLERGRYTSASVLAAASGLVKPQGALLFPVLAAVELQETRPRTWALSAVAVSLTTLLILTPWWTAGYLLSALDGCLRPLRQGSLSALGLNLWWVAGWILEASRHGWSSLAPLLSLDAFRAGAGWDARLVSRVFLFVAIPLALLPLFRRPKGERSLIALSAILVVHAYAAFGTSVHENHTFLAVALAPLLLGVEKTGRPLLVGSSAFLFANLFLAAGFGRRITHLHLLQDIRSLTVPDLSVLIAVFYVGFVAWMLVRGLPRQEERSGPSLGTGR